MNVVYKKTKNMIFFQKLAKSASGGSGAEPLIIRSAAEWSEATQFFLLVRFLFCVQKRK